VAAGITFATLTATVGTDHWRRGYYHHGYFHNHQGDHPDWYDWKKPDAKEDKGQ